MNRQRTSGILAFICFAVAVALLMVMCGCTWDGPALTTADELNEDQMWLSAVIGSRCKEIGVRPWIRFTDETMLVDGTPYGKPGEWLPAAAWSKVSTNTIIVWNEARERYSDSTLDRLGMHECCHHKLGHRKASAQAEVEAEACVAENWGR